MKYLILLSFVLVSLLFIQCGGGEEQTGEETAPPQSMVAEEKGGNTQDWRTNKGVGPVKNVELGDLDEEMAAEGKKLYDTYCTACHKPTEKFIGPAPKDILERRTPEWIMNMILNPEVMVKEDPIAKELLVEYNYAPMANQGLKEEEARRILEYFRTL